jgi:hypothetical protein
MHLLKNDRIGGRYSAQGPWLNGNDRSAITVEQSDLARTGIKSDARWGDLAHTNCQRHALQAFDHNHHRRRIKRKFPTVVDWHSGDSLALQSCYDPD